MAKYLHYFDKVVDKIIEIMPLIVSMVDYGGYEYYGSMSETPENSVNGKLNFENGD